MEETNLQYGGENPAFWIKELINKWWLLFNVIVSLQLLIDALVLIENETHELRIGWTNLKYTLFNAFL